MYTLRQSAHTRHASLFLRFDSHATHACTLQPAASVFVPYGFVLVRVRVLVTCTDDDDDDDDGCDGGGSIKDD